MEKHEEIDVAPAPSHQHQEIAGMHHAGKAWATREPYGPAGMSIYVTVWNTVNKI